MTPYQHYMAKQAFDWAQALQRHGLSAPGQGGGGQPDFVYQGGRLIPGGSP